MHILAADDEALMLETLVDAIREAVPDGDIHAFQKASQLLAFAKNTLCDIAFLDIQMRGMDGLEIAKQLKTQNPKINIVFVTGYDQYTGDALQLRASGYILKPATKEKIEMEMDDLRHPVPAAPQHRIQIHCFGNFNAFVDGKPMKFRYNKTLELLAYLVDRKGALVSTGELMAILWEDKPDSSSMRSQLRNLISDLQGFLRQMGAVNMLIKGGHSYAVDCNAFDCDYYQFLNKDIRAVNSYTGEYMAQYSWAEMTTSALNRLQQL